MLPMLALALVVALTLIAWAVSSFQRRRTGVVLSDLARQFEMRYAATDPFHLAPRIAAGFPVPDCIDLRVYDVVYCASQAGHWYLFTAEYADDPEQPQQRIRRVAALYDCPKAAPRSAKVELAPAGIDLIAQYRKLASQCATTHAPPAAAPLLSSPLPD